MAASRADYAELAVLAPAPLLAPPVRAASTATTMIAASGSAMPRPRPSCCDSERLLAAKEAGWDGLEVGVEVGVETGTTVGRGAMHAAPKAQPADVLVLAKVAAPLTALLSVAVTLTRVAAFSASSCVKAAEMPLVPPEPGKSIGTTMLRMRTWVRRRAPSAAAPRARRAPTGADMLQYWGERE